MAIDREATLKNAEKFLRAGRLDAAIAEYAQVVDEHPHDWNTANALGDLYMRAAQSDQAVAIYGRVADHLFTEGFYPKAAALFKKILKIAPDDEAAQLRLAEISARQGLLADARAYYSAIERRRRAKGEAEAADEIVQRLRALDPEDAARCVEAAADGLLRTGDFSGAARLLQEYAAKSPEHVPTLLKLVEVCVDGGLDVLMFEAQGMLADAYVAAGNAAEARVIAEDLLERDPGSAAHAERLRRALRALNVEDIDAVIGELTAAKDVDQRSEPPPAVQAIPPPATPRQPERPVVSAATVEIDLTALLGELQGQSPPPDATPRPPRELEEVFAGIREEAAGGEDHADSDHLELARTYLEMGMVQEAVSPLEMAARSPRYRFVAATMLAGIHRDEGDLRAAIEWFERAAEAPAPDSEPGREVLYDLADLLETVGETARALAVLLELESEVSGYRDVRERVTRLSRIETEG